MHETKKMLTTAAKMTLDFFTVRHSGLTSTDDEERAPDTRIGIWGRPRSWSFGPASRPASRQCKLSWLLDNCDSVSAMDSRIRRKNSSLDSLTGAGASGQKSVMPKK